MLILYFNNFSNLSSLQIVTLNSQQKQNIAYVSTYNFFYSMYDFSGINTDPKMSSIPIYLPIKYRLLQFIEIDRFFKFFIGLPTFWENYQKEVKSVNMPNHETNYCYSVVTKNNDARYLKLLPIIKKGLIQAQ